MNHNDYNMRRFSWRILFVERILLRQEAHSYCRFFLH